MKRTLRRYLTASTGALVAAGLLLPAAAPVNAAPAAPTTSRVGASISSVTDMSRLSNMMGRPLTSVRVFDQTVKGKWSDSRLLATVPANGTVVWSFKSGTPEQVKAYLSSRPSTTKCYASYWHEPEDELFTAAQKATYRANWVKYAPAIRAAGCKPTLILMKYTLSKGSGRNFRDFWAPGTVDVMAFDAYNTRIKKCACYIEPEKFFAPILAVSKETGLPWGLAEVGSRVAVSQEQRAAWANEIAAAASAKGSLFTLWWDGPTYDFALDTKTARAWNDN